MGFFDLDVDRVRASVLEADVPADLATLQAACRARGIPFGVVFWEGGTPRRGGLRRGEVLAWVDTVGAAIGAPEQIVFQSWSASVDAARRCP